MASLEQQKASSQNQGEKKQQSLASQLQELNTKKTQLNMFLTFVQSSQIFTDITSFYQEVVFLRNALQVLFTEKQWAALNYVGRRIKVMNKIFNTKYTEENT